MQQPEIVAKMIAAKDYVTVGQRISEGIAKNPEERARRRLQLLKNLPTMIANRKLGENPQGTSDWEDVLATLFPEAERNYKVKTGWSSKWQHRAQLYRLDFAWPGIRLDVEVDGYYHRYALQSNKDRIRDLFLKEKGWTVLRFSNLQVARSLDRVKAAIESTISKLQTIPPTA